MDLINTSQVGIPDPLIPPVSPNPPCITVRQPDDQSSKEPLLPASPTNLPKPVSGIKHETLSLFPDPKSPNNRVPLSRTEYSRSEDKRCKPFMEHKEINKRMKDQSNLLDQNQNSLNHRVSPRSMSPIKPAMPAQIPIDLPDKVYWCSCRVSLYKEHLEAGIFELAGSGGAKAFCLFLKKHIINKSNQPLAHKLQVNSVLKVNANLISKAFKVPYLASIVWFEDGPCGPNDVSPAKEEDLIRYDQLVHGLSAALFGPDPQHQVSQLQSQAVSDTPGRNFLNPVPSMRMAPAPASVTNMRPPPVPFANKTTSDGYTQGEVWKAIDVAKSIILRKPPVKKKRNSEHTPNLTQEFVLRKQEEINSISQDQQKMQPFSNKDQLWKALEEETAKRVEEKSIENEKKQNEEDLTNPPRKKLNFLISKKSTLKVSPIDKLEESRNNVIDEQINELQKEVVKKSKLADLAESQSSESAANLYKRLFIKNQSRSDNISRSSKSPTSPTSRTHSKSPNRSRHRSNSRERIEKEKDERERKKRKRRHQWKSMSKSPVRSPNRRSRSPGRSPNRQHKSKVRSPRRRARSPDRSPKRYRRSRSPLSRSCREQVPKTPAFISKHVEEIIKGDLARDAVVDMLASIEELKANKNDKGKVLDNYIYVMIETEQMYDGHYSQFTQIGTSTNKNNQQLKFFRPVLPLHMNEYTNNLVLKNMNSLLSSLNYELNVDENVYKFKHFKKSSINPVAEENALKDFVCFVRNLHEDGMEIILFMNSKEAILPLLLSKIAHFQLETEFNFVVKGFCDLTTCVQKLKMADIWKIPNVLDLNDVYKQITGKSWPKQAMHCDRLSILCGDIIRKIQTDFIDFFKLSNCEFSPTNFLELCGKQTSSEFNKSNSSLLSKIKCEPNSYGMQIKEIEFSQSERPAETAIVNIKKFDIVNIDDEDEIKEMLLSSEAESLKEGQSKSSWTPVQSKERPKENVDSQAPGLPTPVRISLRIEFPDNNAPEPSVSFWDKLYSCEVRKGIELPKVDVNGVPVHKVVSLKIQQNGLPTCWFVGKKGLLYVNAEFKYSQYNALNNPSNKFDFYNIVHKEAWVYISRESSGKEYPCVDVILRNITQQGKFFPQSICPALIKFINPDSDAAVAFPGTPVGDVPIPGIAQYNLSASPVPSSSVSASVTPSCPITVPAKEQVLPNPVPLKHPTPFSLPAPVPVNKKTAFPSKESSCLPVPMREKNSSIMSKPPVFTPAAPEVGSPGLVKLSQSLAGVPSTRTSQDSCNETEKTEIQKATVPGVLQESGMAEEADISNTQSTHIIFRPLRERVIHLLAVRLYTKQEILGQLDKEFSLHKNGKKRVFSIMNSVATLNDGFYHLYKNSWKEVKEDWPFFSEEERNLVNQRQHDNLTPKLTTDNNENILPNSVPVTRDSVENIKASRETAPSKCISSEELKTMSIKRLKMTCEDAGLTKYGTKEDLLEKLSNYNAVN